MSRSFLEVDDLDPARLAAVLDRAMAWKRDPALVVRVLEGKGVAALFEKPSARTRISIEMAVWTLGGHPIYVRGEEVGLDTRESVEDVVRTMAGMCTLIAACVRPPRARAGWRSPSTSIINLLSDRAHPCQALADLLTLCEHFGRLEGPARRITGDGNNVAAPLAFGLRCRASVGRRRPRGYELDADVVARAQPRRHDRRQRRSLRRQCGVDAVILTSDLDGAGERARSGRTSAGFTVDEALLKVASDGAVFACLPAHRGVKSRPR